MSIEENNENLSLNATINKEESEIISKDWTVMIYMAGDNNLSADMAYALADIGNVRNEDLNLMVYYDSAARGAPTLYCDFTDSDKPVFVPSHLIKKNFNLRGKKGNAIRFDENSASAYSLMNFVDWCVNDSEIQVEVNGVIEKKKHKGRRAKRYALILSGHSSGFLNMSLLMDTDSNFFMTVPKLRWALEQITKKEAFKNNIPLLKQEIGILGFDSCVMGMAELGYEFRNVAKTMVASEGSIPSAGWTYGNILAEQVSKYYSAKSADSIDSIPGTQDEKIMATGFVRDFIEKQNDYLIGGVSVDLSVWDLSKIKPVISAVNELGTELTRKLKGDSVKTRERLKRAIIYSHWECQSYMSEQNIDLKDFCQLLRKNIESLYADDSFFDDTEVILECCRKVIETVDSCILLAGFSGGNYQYSNGISLFFPWTELSYKSSLKSYLDLQALENNKESMPQNAVNMEKWNEFLQEFTGSISLREGRQQKAKSTQSPGADEGFPVNEENPDSNEFYPPENVRHNPLLQNDRHNPLLQNDRHNPLLQNDRGLQLFLMNQFKNTRTPWNISGFTKAIAKDEGKYVTKKGDQG